MISFAMSLSTRAPSIPRDVSLEPVSRGMLTWSFPSVSLLFGRPRGFGFAGGVFGLNVFLMRSTVGFGSSFVRNERDAYNARVVLDRATKKPFSGSVPAHPGGRSRYFPPGPAPGKRLTT